VWIVSLIQVTVAFLCSYFFVILEVLLWNLIYILSEKVLPKQLVITYIPALEQVPNDRIKPLSNSVSAYLKTNSM
jgi:hypothetical protein